MTGTRRSPLALAALAGLSLALGSGTGALAAASAPPRHVAVANELLVGFEPGVGDAERRRLLGAVGAAERRRFARIRGALVTLPPARVAAALERLRADRRVRYVERNAVVRAVELPDDPLLDRLWGLRNTGQLVNGRFGTPDADVDADEAWTRETGDPAVVVAVLDTGIDQSHPDLAANTWTNPGESCAGCRSDGRDNDGNGYVDDWRGWDFVGDDNDPFDDNGHGTHVAGTIAAVGDDGAGSVGVAWRSGLMALKFLRADGSGTTADAVAAILYAAENGADVLNNSWAGGEYSQSLRDAIAVADDRDALFVAAAGNDGMDNDAVPTYPASYDVPNVLAVAASDNGDRHAFFSSFGARSVDVSAPGVDVLSTWPGGGHRYASGTSMAAPHVSGAAALLEADDGATSDVGAKGLLLESADPVGRLAEVSATGGRLNAGAALACTGEPVVWLDAPADGFELELGEALEVALSATTCGLPGGLTVSASAGGQPVTLAARGDGAFTGTFPPTAGAPLELVVTAAGPGGAVTRTVTGTVHQVHPIRPGGPPVTVSTTTPGHDLRFGFSANAGDRVSLLLRDVVLAPSLVRIVAPDGSPVGPEAYVGKTGHFVDARTLPAAGEYRIEVDAAAAAVGSITLELFDVPPDASGTITPGGQSVTLTASVPGQNAKATFHAAAGARVSLRLSTVSIKSATVALVRGGTTLATTAVGTAGGFLDVQTLAGVGEHALVVNPQTSYTGSITLTLYDVPPDAGGPIEPDGAAVAVGTTVPGQNARLRFDGAAGERFSVSVGGGLSSAYVSLLGPVGAVGSRQLVGASGGFLDVRTLAATGQHELLVDPQGAVTGSTTVRLHRVPPDVSRAVVAGGPAATVSIAAPGQNASLAFEAAAGTRASIVVSAVSTPSAYVSVVAPGGEHVVRNVLVGSSGAFVDATTLPASGTYSIVVDPIGAATGSLTVALHDVPPDVTGAVVAGAAPLTVAIAAPGQNARLTFEAVAGRRATLTLSAVSVAQSVVSVLRPNGTTLTAALVGPSGRVLTLDPNATGTYVVVVDPRAAATGSLSLRLTEP